MPVGTELPNGVEDEETTALDSADEESEDTAEVVGIRADEADDDGWTPIIKIAPSMSKVEGVGWLIEDFK